MRLVFLIAGIVFTSACGRGATVAAPAPSDSPTAGPVMISAIQGAGTTSPMEGQTVTTRGIVTGDFQENDANIRRNLGGFYVQDGAPDGDPHTSDGIFVFDGNEPAVDVNTGDIVVVTGTVTEYFGETQIAATSVRVTGSGSIKPTPVNLPAARTTSNGAGKLIADLENLEGMYVEFSDTLTVSDLRNLERFGTVTLSEGGRLFQFTNANAPDAEGYSTHKFINARRKIILDDGLRIQNPDDVHYLHAGNTADYVVRLGDELRGLTGNLRFSRGAGRYGDEAWRLMPTIDPEFTSVNPRPRAPDIGGTIRVGGFNLRNFFTTIDTGRDICGPGHDAGCRGANSNSEFNRQIGKTVSALVMSGADILGLTELENNADASLRALVEALNARVGSASYAYIDTGIIHDDVIKAGLVYRSTKVTPGGDFALLDRSVDSRFNDNRNRPSLAQTFAVKSSGARLTVIVNHLKSKGSSCDSDDDPDLGDGQGNCNLARKSAASALADWIATDPTGSNDDDFLIIGDMNAYFLEDPIAALRNAGLIDLLAGQANPYSYLFDAQSGAYDYAFASPSLAVQVVGTIEWHINIDEAPLLDYNLEHGRDPALFDASTPYRAADHDPIIIGLELTN